MLTEVLDIFLRDFGVTCVANGFTFTGILDTPDQTMNMAGVNVMSTMYTVLCKTSDVTAAAITSGTSLTASAIAFRVRDVVLQDDGAFSQLTLSR